MATYIQGLTDILPEPKLYTPDFSFIDKMMQRKAAQYEEGWAQLNNQYNLINREVTNQANAKVRDEFLIAAKNNLKDLSTMDLSDMENVKSAVNVFKPFYTNSLVLGDQALTAHWKQQESVGNSLRLTDGGKLFSEDNMRYVQMQRAAFAADDPSSVGEYAATKRYYSPYYNYNDEIKEAMKNFKPSHTKIERINGMYTVTTEDQSWTPLEISKYLNSVLSDKAKQQMRIEGAVRLGGNLDFLANQYVSTEANKLPALTKLIDKYDEDIKTEKDPNKLLELKQNREYYDNQRAEISNNLKSLRGGDKTFLKKNAESLAYTPYFEGVMGKYADGFSHKDISQEIGFNEVAMMYYREAQQNARQASTQEFEWKKMLYQENRADAREKLKTMAAFSEPLPTAGLPGQPRDNSVTGINARINEAQITAHNAFIDISKVAATSELAKKYGINSVQDMILKPAQAQKLIGEYASIHANDNNGENPVMKWINSKNLLHNRQNELVAYKNQENNQVLQALGTSNFILYKKYQLALSKNGGDANLAARAIGIDPTTIKNIVGTANTAISNYTDKKRNEIMISPKGFLLNQEHPVYKTTMGYLGNAFKQGDVSGLQYYPQSDGTFSIALSVVDKDIISALKGKTDYNGMTSELFKAKLANMFGGQANTVSFDESNNTVVFKNLGSSVAKILDPLNGVSQLHRDALTTLMDYQLSPGQFSPVATITEPDALGKMRNLEFQSYQPYDGNAETYFRMDGVRIDVPYGSPVSARSAAMQMLYNAIGKNPDGTYFNQLDAALEKDRYK